MNVADRICDPWEKSEIIEAMETDIQGPIL